MQAQDIKYIVIHCTAGFTPAAKVQDYFLRPKRLGGRGWKTGGYHRIVELDGKIKHMYSFTTATNGVKGYHREAIHIAYVGGVERGNYKKAKDTRTPEQKEALKEAIVEALCWITNNGGDVSNVKILGHRDFSEDKNGNGVIDPEERIKECPSFDAIVEYKYLQHENNNWNSWNRFGHGFTGGLRE